MYRCAKIKKKFRRQKANLQSKHVAYVSTLNYKVVVLTVHCLVLYYVYQHIVMLPFKFAASEYEVTLTQQLSLLVTNSVLIDLFRTSFALSSVCL